MCAAQAVTRPEQLQSLAQWLLARIAQESGVPTPTLSASLLGQLARHPLRGNVRELENLLHRALALAGDRSAIPTLHEKLTSERAGVALAALEALRQLKEPLDGVLPTLVRHPDEEVVKQALGLAIGSDSAVALGVLREALGHPTWHVRAFAVTGLARVASARSWLSERARVETDPNVQRSLEQALETLDQPGEG